MEKEQHIIVWGKGVEYLIRFIDMRDDWICITTSTANKKINQYVKIEDLMSFLISGKK
jgi:hypothetical protein